MPMSDRLSPNFTLNEFKVSADYPALAQAIQFSIRDTLMLKILCLECLQPIRDHWGPVSIVSGKRTPKLNAAVGGSPHSDHLNGNAADIQPMNESVEPVFDWIVNQSLIPYRQVIVYPDQQFIHIACNHPEKPTKHEALINRGGAYCHA